MAKDYKHRISGKNTLHRHDFDPVKNLSVWKWMLITASAISAVVLVVYFSGVGLKDDAPKQIVQSITKPVEPEKNTEPEKIKKPVEPKPTQFDFYTILPEKEVVVPEYEIKTRTREERVGIAKTTQYVMQAGSYNARKEAEQMQAKLSSMGIEAKIQTAKVDNTIRYRVKMGPFAQIASVNTINARLKQSGIDVIVTETDK
ncbi:MAG: SPOR domain-containing protein [Methylococcaceae bacterium]|nr:SPOR domain-containing protein [Methylococcaceae bacterium]MDD1615479.1 SPOR domain-containing protein [Methylococcaceae bacterium]OYV20235.1 MAG: Sporulation domain-containing protein [Methylococcaceae bacterium NSP1-2]